MPRTLAICIATFQRPELLGRLLASVAAAEPPADCDLELRIIDNDHTGSARAVVDGFRTGGTFDGPVHYAVEPRSNIAHARNAGLDLGPADLIFFCDDDEEIEPHCLAEIVGTADRTKGDVVIGFVGGRVSDRAPRWMERGRYYHHEAGTRDAPLDWRSTRCGCTLVRGAWFFEHGLRFDAQYGRSGGEDTDLFARAVRRGAKVFGAPDARAWEDIPADRERFGWLMRRWWRGGINFHRLSVHDAAPVHPVLRGTARGARETVRLGLGLPALAVGRPDRVIRALLGFALAAGGLYAYFFPQRALGIAAYGADAPGETDAPEVTHPRKAA
jgi:succinoglycan biosynthesis protein ExoM